MDTENLKTLILSNFDVTQINVDSFIVYSPLFYPNTDENLPLVVRITNDECILTDMAEFIEKLENEGVDINKKIEMLKPILDKLNVQYNGEVMISRCSENELMSQISNYYSALCTIWNFLVK